MGAPRKYDWDAWFKRGTFLLIKGREYTCSQSAIAQQVRVAASKRGLSVTLQDVDSGMAVKVKERKRGREEKNEKER